MRRIDDTIWCEGCGRSPGQTGHGVVCQRTFTCLPAAVPCTRWTNAAGVKNGATSCAGPPWIFNRQPNRLWLFNTPKINPQRATRMAQPEPGSDRPRTPAWRSRQSGRSGLACLPIGVTVLSIYLAGDGAMHRLDRYDFM